MEESSVPEVLLLSRKLRLWRESCCCRWSRRSSPRLLQSFPTRAGTWPSGRRSFRRGVGDLSYEAAHTQVAGNRETKPGHDGYTTLVTSVVEGLNILDVVTADLVVAQISTDHPLVGYVPSITFLGTRFENLRIAGHKVDELEMCLDIFGKRARRRHGLHAQPLAL